MLKAEARSNAEFEGGRCEMTVDPIMPTNTGGNAASVHEHIADARQTLERAGLQTDANRCRRMPGRGMRA